MTINETIPVDWRDLQNQVARILSECSMRVEIEKDITTSRDTVNVDVLALDNTRKPSTIYLCECKYWRSAVPKTVVHAFRTVVNDYGANGGFIISSNGFQQGAYTAAQYTNIQLLTWEEFEALFVDKWYEAYFKRSLSKAMYTIVDIGDARINLCAALRLHTSSPNLRRQLKALRNKYEPLAELASSLCDSEPPTLPLQKVIDTEGVQNEEVPYPRDILAAETLRDLLAVYTSHFTQIAQEFEELVK